MAKSEDQRFNVKVPLQSLPIFETLRHTADPLLYKVTSEKRSFSMSIGYLNDRQLYNSLSGSVDNVWTSAADLRWQGVKGSGEMDLGRSSVFII